MLGEVVAVSVPVNDSDCSFGSLLLPLQFKADFDGALLDASSVE